LREGLPASWSVVGNFTFAQGGRSFECDALAVGPDGWGFLVEVKEWRGRIRGNDAQWELPGLGGHGHSYRPNPVELIQLKAKALASMLREQDPPLKAVFVEAVVALVSDEPPELDGRCAAATVLLRDLVARVLEDPRPYPRRPPSDAVPRVVEVLTRTARPIAPANVLGSWELTELAATGPSWEIWSARPRLGGAGARPMRLKRYRLDPLLVGDQRAMQLERARRDLNALERLAGADGAVPPVSAIDDAGDSLVVVTDWPDGESLASLITADELDQESAEEVFEALVTALASVHRIGVIHRNLSPTCAHYLPAGRVVLTDFDYARLPGVASVTQDFGEELANAWAAPEVRRDPASTTKASDVWSAAAIGLQLFGGTDAGVEEVPSHLRDVLSRALSEDAASRPPDAELLLAEIQGDVGGLFDGFEPNDELEDRWVVRSEPIGEGGIARVYKVFDTVAERDYAAKFVRDEYKALIDPAEEYRLLYEVPDHPGLVKPEIPQRITRYRRNGRQRERQAVFVPTRWIDGPRLDRLLAEQLPIERCIELTLSIAEAVAHLHKHDLLHRDLKPENVIVEQPSGWPLVVDFNVSRGIGAAGRTATGTEPYRPPDLLETGWAFGSDVYAIGVVLCELLAGRLLRPDCRTWLRDAAVPVPLREFLGRATAETANDRFDDVQSFVDALEAAAAELRAAIETVDEVDFPRASAEEVGRPNWNPYQHRLVTLFSQSSVTNAGTRGLDAFGRWAYVPTVIDERLFPEAISGQHALVVITGNAGDGKTAFIQVLEQRLSEQGAVAERHAGGNGATLEWQGRRFVTNWDGSQDEEEADNDRVLAEFFAPFAGADPQAGEGETRIIAINEGRLLDFLAHRRDDFPWLSRVLLDFFTEQVNPPVSWLTVVNLNLRALTTTGDARGSIVGRLLERFADERLWEPCAGCSAFDHCYARSNAEVLRHPVLGKSMAERVRHTLEVARLRRRLHITMRDLRSALAFAVAGNRTCDEIVALVEGNDGKALLAGHTYNALFAGSAHLAAHDAVPGARQDRLLALVGTLDVARTADPADDGRLWTLGVDAIRPDPAGVERSDRLLLGELRERLPNGSADLADRQARADLRLLQASLRRKLYLEREDPGWLGMLPYDRLDRFMRQLADCDDEERRRLVRAIANSEGLFNPAFQDVLAVRLAPETDGPARSFVTHDADDFVLESIDRSGTATYVEYAPDALRLRHVDRVELELEVDLDLYETLSRILDGFTPSREELRGAWLNLRIFKDQLAAFGADTLLLTLDDRRFFRVEADDAGAVAIEEAR
jgi:serine/threonine protein kinase